MFKHKKRGFVAFAAKENKETQRERIEIWCSGASFISETGHTMETNADNAVWAFSVRYTEGWVKEDVCQVPDTFSLLWRFHPSLSQPNPRRTMSSLAPIESNIGKLDCSPIEASHQGLQLFTLFLRLDSVPSDHSSIFWILIALREQKPNLTTTFHVFLSFPTYSYVTRGI